MANEELKKLLKDAIAGKCYHHPRGFHKILAIGSKKSILSYDALKNAWEEWSEHSNGRFFGATIVGENVLFIGGLDHVNQSKVSVYNIKTKVWKDGPSLRSARYFHATCVNSENTIYAVGGFVGGHASNSVEMLKCDETGEPIGTWQTVRPMGTARSFFESAIIDDKVYAVGGHPNLPTMEVFDPKTNIWKDCTSMAQGKDHHTVTTYNAEIYVFGLNGFSEKYNPATDTWTDIAALNYANRNVFCRGSAVLNDKIYLIGGHNNTETDIYDVETNKWSKGPPMPKQIGWTKCVSRK